MRFMIDPQGAAFYVIEPASSQQRPEAAPEVGDASWHELLTTDAEAAMTFYQEVFGFRDSETRRTRDHVSRHMTDGGIDFTLIRYDAGTQSAESRASGDGPCIHHFAIEVVDLDTATQQIKAYGSQVVRGSSDLGPISIGRCPTELKTSAATDPSGLRVARGRRGRIIARTDETRLSGRCCDDLKFDGCQGPASALASPSIRVAFLLHTDSST